jgi:hypothetical protein
VILNNDDSNVLKGEGDNQSFTSSEYGSVSRRGCSTACWTGRGHPNVNYATDMRRKYEPIIMDKECVTYMAES